MVSGIAHFDGLRKALESQDKTAQCIATSAVKNIRNVTLARRGTEASPIVRPGVVKVSDVKHGFGY